MISHRPFERFLLRAASLALILVVVSLALIAWGVTLAEGFLKTLVLTLATAGLSIGGISFLYEAYLRRTLTQDVLALMHLDEEIVASGIQQVAKKNAVNWNAFFDNTEHVRLVPADPPAWIRDEWVFLIDARLRRGGAVEVYLPNPDAPILDVLAARLDHDEVEFRQELRRVLREIETSWKQKYAHQTGYRLTVYTYDGAPTMGLSVADKRAVLSLPGLLRFQAAPKVACFRFDSGEDDFVGNWINEQIESLPQLGTYFTT